MHLIDEQYTKTPFYGSRRMAEVLKRKNHKVNRKRIQRLMRLMGIETIYPRPNLSKPHPGHKIYPYLLRNLKINRVNQVWGTDGYYLHQIKTRLALFSGHNGLDESLCPVLGVVY